MGSSEHGRRRIDRVTDDSYLEGLEERSAAELRAMRDECRDEEAHLSYTRRLLQGRVDIARAELARRSGEHTGDLVETLPSILADAPGERPTAGRPAAARSTPVFAPGGGRRREDMLVDDGVLGRIPDLSDEELTDLTERLEADERRVSGLRRIVLDRLDALQAELINRYRDGEVPVDEIVSSAAGDPPDTGQR